MQLALQLLNLLAVGGGGDVTPDQFSFTDQSGVALSTVITSAPVTITGMTASAPCSVTGGEQQLNGGAFTTSDITVQTGDDVTLRHTSSASYLTATHTTATISGVSDTFTSITEGDPANAAYIGRPFSFNWWSH